MNNKHKTNSIPFPLDKFTITTCFPVQEMLVSDEESFRQQTGLELRVSSPKNNYTDENKHQSRDLYIGTCGGLTAEINKPPHGRWTCNKIQVNPGKILYGHNGRPLNEDGVLVALSLARDLLLPLLANPADHLHLIPGLCPEGSAFFSYVEIFINLHDPNGALQHAFRNPKHPEIRKAAMHVEGESVKLGNGRSQLQIEFYRKDLELAQLIKKRKAPDPARVLRIEVRLKGEKLVESFTGNGSIREIGGKNQLVGFTGSGLVAVHLAKMLKLTGCFHHPGDLADLPRDNVLGRSLGQLCHHYSINLADVVAMLAKRFDQCEATIRRHRNAALDELSLISPFRLEDMFSPEAYAHQAGISIPKLENMLRQRRESAVIDPRIAAVYGTKPAGSYQLTQLFAHE